MEELTEQKKAELRLIAQATYDATLTVLEKLGKLEKRTKTSTG